MSEKPISPLRQRMIEDMTVRRFGEANQRNYIRDGFVTQRCNRALSLLRS